MFEICERCEVSIKKGQELLWFGVINEFWNLLKAIVGIMDHWKDWQEKRFVATCQKISRCQLKCWHWLARQRRAQEITRKK